MTRAQRGPSSPATGGPDAGHRSLPGAVRVGGGSALRGGVRAPGDKSISHRAVLIGALAHGRSVVRGLSDGEDVQRTVVAVAQLGGAVERLGEDEDGRPALAVSGGRGRLRAPAAPIECGNSGTCMRLLMGVVAGLDGETVLVGDESLSRRPMDRVAAPLAAMGASVSGTGERCLPPVTVRGARLRGVTWTPEVASAQVKSAILLAGLGAEGETVVHEPVRTRTHTEELLEAVGAAVTVEDDGTARTVRIGPSSDLAPLELDVPGDPSQAAFWVVAATVVPGSEVVVRNVYAGAERTGFVGVLERMGAAVRLLPATPPRPGVRAPEHHGRAGAGPVADVSARAAPLRSTVVHAEEIPSLDEVPVLAVAAACAAGTTTFVDMRELRVKETDRLEAVVRLLRALGAGCEVVGDDLLVHGTAPDGGTGRLRHADIDSGGDHRIAMAAAVAALAAGPGESGVEGFGAVGTSYPAFLDHLRALGGVWRLPLVAIDGPAGSGKSTVSKALAARLGLDRLDTGAMYRAVAWAVLDRGGDPGASEEVADLARRADIEVGPERVAIDGTVVTREIRTPAVNRAVSVVAANPGVRAALVERQRAWVAAHGGGVVEGRDIGTVVFPGADLKVFLTASPEERARRRRGDEAPDGVARRDRIDSTRTVSPLTAADDARRLDTTGRSVDDVVEEILSWL